MRISIRSVLPFVAIAVSSVAFAKDAPDTDRQSAIKIVTQIQRADYEGDRTALAKLYADLSPFTENKDLASRVNYWRGFALWRRAINGFNETPTPPDLEADLKQAVAEFQQAIAKDPKFTDAKIGAVSSLGYQMFLSGKDTARTRELLAQSSPLLKDAMAADPDNPRLAWIMGPIRWNTPPERGGGQDKAIASYQKALEYIRAHKNPSADPVEPTWGEPELLMNLAWSDLNRNTPDVAAADQNARAALDLVPYWHYVRDILMPQIREAKAKAK
jgi:tetratricopeptide (TPR) repeat protein